MSLNLTMNRAFGLLEDNIRQKQENFQETMRSKETMERLRQETLLEKQRLTNQGQMSVTERQQVGETRRTGMTQQGQLAQRLAVNTGARDVANIEGKFSLERQGLVNQGGLATQQMRNTGATDVANIQVGGQKYVADAQARQAKNRLIFDRDKADNDHLINTYEALTGTGSGLGQEGSSFSDNRFNMMSLVSNPDADAALAAAMRAKHNTETADNAGKTDADKGKKPEEKRRTTTNDRNNKNARSNPAVPLQTPATGAGPRSSVAWPRSTVPALGRAVNRRTDSMVDSLGRERINRMGR